MALFEPVASTMELAGEGYIVASIGRKKAAEVPYTCFMATKDYLVYKELHASKQDNFFIFCVILNQRTPSTLSSSALKMKKFSPFEVSRVRRHKICVMQGA